MSDDVVWVIMEAGVMFPVISTHKSEDEAYIALEGTQRQFPDRLFYINHMNREELGKFLLRLEVGFRSIEQNIAVMRQIQLAQLDKDRENEEPEEWVKKINKKLDDLGPLDKGI